MNDLLRFAGWTLVKLLGAVALAFLVYLVTAPPLMILMTRKNPRGEWPWVYRPLVAGFQCDWTRPAFSWYFDKLWKADTELLGE
jgi:hypothetical protein